MYNLNNDNSVHFMILYQNFDNNNYNPAEICILHFVIYDGFQKCVQLRFMHAAHRSGIFLNVICTIKKLRRLNFLNKKAEPFLHPW